jgi:hypothetical protein
MAARLLRHTCFGLTWPSSGTSYVVRTDTIRQNFTGGVNKFLLHVQNVTHPVLPFKD